MADKLREMLEDKTPPAVRLTSDEEKRLGETLEMYNDARDFYLVNHFARHDALQKLKYRFLEGDGRVEDVERHRLNIPLAFSNIETVKPLMLAQNPKFGISLRGAEDSAFSQANDKLFEYQWDAARGPLKVAELVEDMLVYGTGIGYVPWEERYRRVTSVEGVTVPIRLFGLQLSPRIFARPVEKRIKKFAGPTIRPIAPGNFFPDRWAYEINGDAPAWYVTHEEWMTGEQVMGYFRRGQWDQDKMEQAFGTEPPPKGDDLTERMRTGRNPVLESRGAHIGNRKMFHVVHFWMLEDEQMTYRVMLNERLLVKDGESPFGHGDYPYIRLTDYDVPREFWAIGEVEIVQHLQYLFNDIYNLRIDAATLNMVPMWVSERNNFDDDLDHFVFRPGAIYEANRPDKLTPFPQANVGSVGYNEEEGIHRLFSLVSGVSALLKLPESSPVQRSATGAEIVQRISNIRMQNKLRQLDFQAMRELAYQWFSLNNLFLTQRDVSRVVGDDLAQSWKNLPIEDGAEVPFDVKFQMASEAPLNKESMRQELLTLVNVAATNEPMSIFFQQAGVWQVLAEKVTESFGMQEATALLKEFRQMQAVAPPPPPAPPPGQVPPGQGAPPEGAPPPQQ